MSNVDQRLEECFAIVFSKLSKEQLRSASMESVAEWDSLATLTLVSVIQEEFNIQIPIEDLPRLASFVELHGYLESPREIR